MNCAHFVPEHYFYSNYQLLDDELMVVIANLTNLPLYITHKVSRLLKIGKQIFNV